MSTLVALITLKVLTSYILECLGEL